MKTDKKNNAVQQTAAKDTHAAERKSVEAAHEQAEHDMDTDPDLSIHSPNDDLDEGETSRLGEDMDGII